MGETEGGFRKGFGQGAGCCAFAVLVPVAMVGLVWAMLQPGTQRRQVHVVTEEQHREEAKIIALQAEREAKLAAAGVTTVPEVAIQTEAELRKQMRIEGIEADQGLVDIFVDANARGENLKPLRHAAKIAKQGREDDVQMLVELAGVKKGDSMKDVMMRFDAPDRRGETNEVLKYSQGWPDMMYYSYSLADVTFLVSGGKVDLILVGLAYPEAAR